jgi:hypothetical protein
MNKPWPTDAVIIVASLTGNERRENMQAVVRCICRDCYRLLSADSHTIGEAAMLPSRRDRPVDFICPDCFTKYDHGSITITVDDRDHKKGVDPLCHN